LQGLTRELKTPLVVSDTILCQIAAAATGSGRRCRSRPDLQGERELRGRSAPVRI